MTTHVLGRGWFASQLADGGMTFRNPDKGQRFDLMSDSVGMLRAALAGATPAPVTNELRERVEAYDADLRHEPSREDYNAVVALVRAATPFRR